MYYLNKRKARSVTDRTELLSLLIIKEIQASQALFF